MNQIKETPPRALAPLAPGGIAEEVGVVAFDADDTLWDCQEAFESVETDFCRMLSRWGTRQEVREKLATIERRNLPLTGYGAKAFTISLVEAALDVSAGRCSGEVILRAVGLGKRLLRLSARPLPGVEEALRRVREAVNCPVVVFTKGELIDQEGKMERSGLRKYFDEVVTVADKTPQAYHTLCHRLHTRVEDLLMVGNSFRSDIDPVLRLGGWAAYVPYHATWSHEQMPEYAHPRLWRLPSLLSLTEDVSGSRE